MCKYVIVFLLFIACQQNPKNLAPTTTSDTTIIEQNNEIDLRKLPPQFLSDLAIDSWEDLTDLQESVENLATLNKKSISIYLINLRGLTQKMDKNQFPDPFNIPPIKSRLKVVQMQVDKCLYFTRYYKEDSLVVALEQLYNHYNAFLDRIISLSEEKQALPNVSVKEEDI